MYRPVIDRIALRGEEIARIDAISRTRALTEAESIRLQNLLYRERYDAHRARRRHAA
ncbi:hypothetical protein [Sphingomonas melonis]|uniref:hypothetical protein n=1 Tax=Sphingomonas melonis TaxID=152682 RepID=UPI00036BE49D|nr:hypothetical protein [Sphingomonas melonis]